MGSTNDTLGDHGDVKLQHVADLVKQFGLLSEEFYLQDEGLVILYEFELK